MNQKIHEIYQQTGYHDVNPWAKEQFAFSIVNQCVEVIEKEKKSIDTTRPTSAVWIEMGLGEAIEKIKEHFTLGSLEQSKDSEFPENFKEGYAKLLVEECIKVVKSHADLSSMQLGMRSGEISFGVLRACSLLEGKLKLGFERAESTEVVRKNKM